MLRWLHKNVPKRFQIIGLVGISAVVGHLVILFMLLSLYKGQFYRYDLQVVNQLLATDVEVIFTPLAKSVVKKTAPVKKPQPKKAVAPKKGAAKTPPPSTQMVTQTKKIEKKDSKPIEKQDKKPEVKPVEKKVEPKIPEKPIEKPTEPAAAQPQQQTQSPASSLELQKIEIGQREYDALAMQQELQTLVSNHWQPPAGMDDVACTIKIIIGHDGVVADCVVEKSSGNLLYDTAAKQGAHAIAYPTWARGKELGITFCQHKE